MYNFKIDHFVIGCKKLEEGTNFVENLLHENLSDINKHISMQTHNRVISLGDNYLEVISIDPDSKLKHGSSWFELDNKKFINKFLNKPKLISFVISGNENKVSQFYEKKFMVRRDSYKWFFQKPNKKYLSQKKFKNINSFPSFISWLSPPPIKSMIKSSYKLESLKITLNHSDIFFYDFIVSLKMKENICFNFTDKKSDYLPCLQLNLKNEKNNRKVVIS